jgi:hypothetical protein
MKRYEYKATSVQDLVGPLATGTMGDVVAGMNELGKDGWRFVSVIGDAFAVFERELQGEGETTEGEREYIPEPGVVD